ncbi:hypothetical protein K2173_004384 [Erythroxylum novogranatense]|uniref:PLAC8 family protein n=1 Tax=Erythroxylum novogranatense TaxID=1862640 RepID=A0AAV8T4Z5_9ROSI|nr:hypothetical protein K2173_004384 [Erythroxylum novogranatense]
MGDLEKGVKNSSVKTEEEEEERLMEVLDFDLLCSTVALQTQGTWTKLRTQDVCDSGAGAGNGGVFRMWEGELLDCCDIPRIAIQSFCCPCYRFGKNMRRAGLGPCFLQGIVYYFIALVSLLSFIAFAVSKRDCFLYLSICFTISIGIYLGFFRNQMRKKFNIRGNDGIVDDCIYHLFCPCCSLCQESRTLEMNNVQDGIWHGRGDTLCIGTYSEANNANFELPSSLV